MMMRIGHVISCHTRFSPSLGSTPGSSDCIEGTIWHPGHHHPPSSSNSRSSSTAHAGTPRRSTHLLRRRRTLLLLVHMRMMIWVLIRLLRISHRYHQFTTIHPATTTRIRTSRICIQWRQLWHGRCAIKIRLLPYIPTLLPRCRSTHMINHIGISAQKMFMIVRTTIGTLASHTFESPPIHLPNEALVACLGKVMWTNLCHKVFLVNDAPGPSVRHPRDGMMKFWIAENVVEFHWEDCFGPCAGGGGSGGEGILGGE